MRNTLDSRLAHVTSFHKTYEMRGRVSEEEAHNATSGSQSETERSDPGRKWHRAVAAAVLFAAAAAPQGAEAWMPTAPGGTMPLLQRSSIGGVPLRGWSGGERAAACHRPAAMGPSLGGGGSLLCNARLSLSDEKGEDVAKETTTRVSKWTVARRSASAGQKHGVIGGEQQVKSWAEKGVQGQRRNSPSLSPSRERFLRREAAADNGNGKRFQQRRGGGPRNGQAPHNGRHQNRAKPEQIKLNQKIAACGHPREVFEAISEAKSKGVELNSVNLATALHRVAKTGTVGDFRGLKSSEPYAELLDMVKVGLESKDGDLTPGDFNPREIGNMAWGIAKAQMASAELFELLQQAAERIQLSKYKPQELSNSAWAFATGWNNCQGEERRSLVRGVGNMMSLIEEEILRRAEVGRSGGNEQSLEEFKPQELSNTLWALATVGRDNEDVFACLEEEILGRGIENFASQDISNSVWAFVTAGQAVPGLLEAVSAGIDARGASAFKNQELTNIVWAYAKVDSHCESLFTNVASEIKRRRLSTFHAQELSNLVWGFSTVGEKDGQLLELIEEEAVRRGLQEFKSQELANMAWAFAKVGHTSLLLFDELERELLHRRDLSAFIPQELSNVLWSFAKLSFGTQRLFKTVGDEMLRRGLACFKTQELSNAVWAHATTGNCATELFVEVEKESLRRGLGSFTPQDLSNMIWAFAKGDHVASLLYEQMKGQFERMKEDEGGLSCFKAQELSNILWSCAKTQHWAKGHFHLAEREAKGVLAEAAADGEGGVAEADSMVPLEVSDEIWKAAVIGKCAEVMFETIEEELCTRDLDTFNTQHLANMAWAFVVLEHSRFNRQSLSGHKLLKRLLEVSEARMDEFAIEELRQLGQVTVATREREEGGREEGFAKKVKDALAREHVHVDTPDSSEFHRTVAETMKKIGVPITNEVKFFEGVYHIDIVIGDGDPESPPGKIAVEVDGPTHFIHNSAQPTPHTALKRWLLEREGYEVIPVPYFEWSELNGEEDHEAYLRHKLNGVGWDVVSNKLERIPGRKAQWTF